MEYSLTPLRSHEAEFCRLYTSVLTMLPQLWPLPDLCIRVSAGFCPADRTWLVPVGRGECVRPCRGPSGEACMCPAPAPTCTASGPGVQC